MSCETIFKDICRIHARLFDHRPAFQGHANFFAKEFEEKRGDREKLRLDRVLEIVTNAKDHVLPETDTVFSDNLKVIAEKVGAAAATCQHILARQETRKSQFLETQREARQQAFEQFMQQQCFRSARIDQQFDENIKLFNSSYDDLNDQLEKGVPFSSQTYYKFMALGKEFS
ncbi:biogenesis of lysosome-related organelles complex 1 subunit 5-like [Pomacea canaliculata]|uniref:biogenesis of lysosome-related organelles complex 1 subunit 5-like n=1 Tax=Pomacea canaliculata TaxID=400727 RepID=UPI000D729321|nr:biogenesis of lysosome-related organelles complex 1 subunit 5-like [Pomacea canaliculata]